MGKSLQSIRSLSSVLGMYITVGNNEEIRYCCPICIKRKGSPDRKHHLYISPDLADRGKPSWTCHRCGASGILENLFKVCGLGFVQDLTPISDWDNRIQDFLNSTAGLMTVGGVGEVVHLPNKFLKLTSAHKADQCYKYLISRGLNDSDIDFYKFGSSIEYPKSVIVYDGDHTGTILFWQARYFGDNPDIPKYRNPLKADKSKLIYNYYNCLGEEEVIITEGVFSAISAGRNAVATYGKKISTEQVNLLLSLPAKRVCVSLDPDALQESMKLCHALAGSKQVFFTILPEGTDPNDLGRTGFQQYLDEAQEWNAMSSLRLRMSGLPNGYY